MIWMVYFNGHYIDIHFDGYIFFHYLLSTFSTIIQLIFKTVPGIS